MVMKCGIILDLLPLYASGSCSRQSKKLVDAHIAQCPDCAAALQRMMHPKITAPEQTHTQYSAEQAFQKARRNARRKGWIKETAIILLMLMLVLVAPAGSGLTPYLHPSSIRSRRIANDFAQKLQTQDYEGLMQYCADGGKIYDQKLAELNALLEVGEEERHLVDIDGELCYVPQSVYENEYQAYLRTKDADMFWMEMITLNQGIVPQKNMEAIMTGEQYTSMIQTKFGFEQDYGKYSDNYLAHAYRLLEEDAVYYRGGYYYLVEYYGNHLDDSAMYGTERYYPELQQGVRFVWEQDMQPANDAKASALQQEISMGREAFCRRYEAQYLQALQVLEQGGARIAEYQISHVWKEAVWIDVLLEDTRNEQAYKELSDWPIDVQTFRISLEVEKGKITHIRMRADSGLLTEQFTKERGLEVTFE